MSTLETVTAEEYKEQFGRHGFLAPVIDLISHNNRVIHNDWFELARDTNACLQAIALKAMEEHVGAIGDKNVLSTLLLLRSLGLLQGSIMMLEKGMLVEARILMRAMLETSFCLGAIHDDADAFVAQFKSDHRKSSRQQAEAAISCGALDPASDQFQALTKTIETISKSEQLMRMTDIGKTGPLARSVLLYKIMSNDSAHNSVTSVLNHFDHDKGQFSLGPAENDKIELNLDNLVLIATGIGVGFTNIVGDVESNLQVTTLCQRYGALRAKASGGCIPGMGAGPTAPSSTPPETEPSPPSSDRRPRPRAPAAWFR